MTATSPVHAIQYPDLTNVKDQVAQLATLNTNIDKAVIPRFANTSARDAAITSPTAGQLAYSTQDHYLTYYAGGAWRIAETSKTLYKTIAETVTSAVTTMNTDDTFVFYAEANSAYHFDLVLHYSGLISGDAIKTAWTGPSGATARRLILGSGPGNTSRQSPTIQLRAIALTEVTQYGTHSSAGVPLFCQEYGTIATGSTAGLISLTWGKPTAYAGTLSVVAGSFFTYRKIS